MAVLYGPFLCLSALLQALVHFTTSGPYMQLLGHLYQRPTTSSPKLSCQAHFNQSFSSGCTGSHILSQPVWTRSKCQFSEGCPPKLLRESYYYISFNSWGLKYQVLRLKYKNQIKAIPEGVNVDIFVLQLCSYTPVWSGEPAGRAAQPQPQVKNAAWLYWARNCLRN